MRFSTFELLQCINKKGKLFLQNNCLILVGEVFPFFFLRYLKKIVEKEYGIQSWLNSSEEGNNDLDKYLPSNNFYYYKENKTVYEAYAQFGYIIEIKEKSEVNNIKKIIDKAQNNFYIFFVSSYYENNMRGYNYYSLDDSINNYNSRFLLEFFDNYYIEQAVTINFFLQYFYEKIADELYLEFFFNLIQFVINIKKNNIFDCMTDYMIYSKYLLCGNSIFDLATCFFQKKRVLFFEKWENIKHKYSIEFWCYFWQDQLWYAQLTLLNKENIHDAVFLKKVNRWFLKTGISIYKPAELFQAAHRLYTIDYLYKKLQTNLELDLDSFFYLWFII